MNLGGIWTSMLLERGISQGKKWWPKRVEFFPFWRKTGKVPLEFRCSHHVLTGFPMVPNYTLSAFCHLFQKLFIIASHFISYALHIRCLKEISFLMYGPIKEIHHKKGNHFGCNPPPSHPQQVTNALLPWQLQH